MIRILFVISVIFVLLGSYLLYQKKAEIWELTQELNVKKDRISKLEKELQIMRVKGAKLISPNRIERLARKHLPEDDFKNSDDDFENVDKTDIINNPVD